MIVAFINTKLKGNSNQKNDEKGEMEFVAPGFDLLLPIPVDSKRFLEFNIVIFFSIFLFSRFQYHCCARCVSGSSLHSHYSLITGSGSIGVVYRKKSRIREIYESIDCPGRWDSV